MKPGVVMVYSFQYRGQPEEWSQKYHFTGSAPSDDAGWVSLIESLRDIVKEALTDRVTIVRAYGYHDTAPGHDADYVYEASDHGGAVAGLIDTSTAIVAPGDAAAWVRWKTSRTNTHGKPIYLRKYFHGCILSGSADDTQDSLAAAYKSQLETFATDVQSSLLSWPGLAGPNGDETFLASSASTYVTTRTLERRGKRPH